MIFAILTALWLGVLTSISPCPLATNIAAISFLSKNISSPRKTLLAGILYTLGRIATYVILGAILVSGLLQIPTLANFLQTNINKAIGPLLIIVGIVLLEVFKPKAKEKKTCGCGCNNDFDPFEKLKKSGLFGGFVLGMIFALSFCPISAALFFGSLTTLALEQNSRFLLPLSYGIGTGFPVVIFAIVITFFVNKVGVIQDKMLKFEFWFKKITGVIFILAGFYFIATHYLGM